MRRGCALAFLALCAGVMLFLQRFTQSEPSFVYPAWETGAVVSASGGETAFDPAGLPPELGEGELYRFTMTLPEGRTNGDFLIFETAGMEVSVRLDGAQLWYSLSDQDPETANQSQARIPLSAGGGEALTLDLRPLSEAAIVPPILRLSSDPSDQAGTIAYANFYGLPAGATALALILLGGLFLLGASQGRWNWSLLLPVLAAALLTVHRLTRGYGPYFLPQPVQDLFSHRWLEWLAALALLLYLALQRDRAFRRALGALAAWSAGALAAAALFSFLRGGYLSLYLSSLAEQVLLGFWDGPLYWLNGWLVLVCAALSAWAVVRTLAASRAEASALRLKGNLMMESYRALEAKLREGAAARHETAHRLTALDALYQTGDWAGLGRLLEELGEQNARLSRTAFSPNFAVNAILQDAEARARAAGIRLEVRADVPEQLPVPVEDLCALLMNLLDNAPEGAARVEAPGERLIRFRAAAKDGYFAVRCENSYAGPLAPDERGRLRTTKADPEAHGFGLPQMSAVAEKYGSLLDVSYTDRVFTVQTALKLPAAQASA